MPSSAARLLATLALSLLAVPASAGTLYVPLLAPREPANATYQTRIWLTNHGDGAATVTTVRMRGIVDGTDERDAPIRHRVAPGATVVLTPGPAPGLLEVRTPVTVAVGAELRNVKLPGPLEVYGAVPVIGSENLAEGGRSLLLQGLRRSAQGVRTHLGVINLGPKPALCDVEIRAASGVRLGKADGIAVPALSHVPIEDVLDLLDVRQVGDAHAVVSCSRRFYAYLASIEAATGEAVFHTPSATGASTLKPPAAEPPSGGGGGTDGKSLVSHYDGVVFVPSTQKPTWTDNIQVPGNTDFRKVVVDVDVTVGTWDKKEPNKAHSLFWLHRGGRHGNDWPTWANNMIGYANAYGPGANKVKIKHNLSANRPYPGVVSSVALQRGKTYHVHYEYDAAGGKVSTRISSGGQVISNSTSAGRVKKIRSDASGQFMLYFGHTKHKGAGKAGPEKPTYGWKYANARVELVRF